jgi:hypothetical protein
MLAEWLRLGCAEQRQNTDAKGRRPLLPADSLSLPLRNAELLANDRLTGQKLV